MLNLIAEKLPIIESRAEAGNQIAQECILFYQLATEKGCSHAAGVIARDKFLLMFPEYADFQESPVLPPAEEKGPSLVDLAAE